MIINSRNTTNRSSQQSLGSSFLISKPTTSTWLGRDLHFSHCKATRSVWKQLEMIQEPSAGKRSLKTTRAQRYFHSAPSNLLAPVKWFQGSPAPNYSHGTKASRGKSQSIRGARAKGLEEKADLGMASSWIWGGSAQILSSLSASPSDVARYGE